MALHLSVELPPPCGVRVWQRPCACNRPHHAHRGRWSLACSSDHHAATLRLGAQSLHERNHFDMRFPERSLTTACRLTTFRYGSRMGHKYEVRFPRATRRPADHGRADRDSHARPPGSWASRTARASRATGWVGLLTSAAGERREVARAKCAARPNGTVTS
jgi:hypothetical protein